MQDQQTTLGWFSGINIQFLHMEKTTAESATSF